MELAQVITTGHDQIHDGYVHGIEPHNGKPEERIASPYQDQSDGDHGLLTGALARQTHELVVGPRSANTDENTKPESAVHNEILTEGGNARSGRAEPGTQHQR